MRKILIINANPDPESFNKAIAETYLESAKISGAEVKAIHLGELNFNPNLQFGYRKRTDLESDLLEAIELIKWSEHIVWIYPIWWIGYPAILKGFIDRTFLPNIFFLVGETYATTGEMIGLLKGRSSHIINTADTTEKVYIEDFSNVSIIQLKITLNLCGITDIKNTFFGPVVASTEDGRKKWLEKVAEIAKNEVAC